MPSLAGPGRADHVRRMFAQVAPRYDLLNHLLSGGLDLYWRRLTARLAPPRVAGPIVDLCCGTGDLGRTYALSPRGRDRPVLGFDFCEPMVTRGMAKLARRRLDRRVRLGVADALRVPVASGRAAVVCVAFGVRNTDDLPRAIGEMARLAAPGGTVAILEFSLPTGPLFGPLYLFYFRKILPFLGRLISSASVDAYRYLPESVLAFPPPEKLLACMTEAGLVHCRRHAMTLGTVSLYIGTKPIGRDK